jgi:8-oxo-dGTP pyrophosphatase MutT (NUDIX family)
MTEATCLFLQEGDRVLLAMKKRGFGEGKWNGIGGKLDPDETPKQAAIRETQEEILVTPKNLRKAAELTFDEFHNGEPYQVKVHVFTATQWEGEPTETEEMAPQWFPVDQLPLTEMWPDDQYWLEKVLGGTLIKGYFKLDRNDQIIQHSIEEIVSL